MDPGTDSLLLQSALAALIAGPWFVRGQVTEAVSRVRRRWSDTADAQTCPLPGIDEEPPAPKSP